MYIYAVNSIYLINVIIANLVWYIINMYEQFIFQKYSVGP